MRDKLNQLPEKFNQQSARNRLLITFCVALILIMLFDLFWLGANRQKIKQINTEINANEQQLADLTQAQIALNTNVYQNRNNPKQKHLAKIEQQLEVTRQSLELRAVNLVQPEAMAPLLKNIINNSKNLKLISLTKLPAQPLLLEAEQDSALQMYQHPVELTFNGGYEDTQKFLNELENSLELNLELINEDFI